MEQQTAAQQPAQQNFGQAKSGSKGWMIAAIIFGLGFLGTGGYSIYNAMNNSGTQQDSTSNGGTKCDVKDEVTGTGSVDTGSIAQTQDSDYTVAFKKSGIKLNLGSEFAVINTVYTQNPMGDPFEQILLGGLTENSEKVQNLPTFSYGNMPTNDFDLAKQKYWLVMETINVYQKSWWDAQGIDQLIAEAEANGVMSSYNVVYRDNDYIVTYSHPQNTISESDWERAWEESTYKKFNEVFNESSNWSR